MNNFISYFCLVFFFRNICHCTKIQYTINITSFNDLPSESAGNILQSINLEDVNIKDAFGQYQKTNTTRFDTVTNLNSVLDVFGEAQCLVILSNFRGVNLKPAPFSPIIIRRVVYVQLHVSGDNNGESFIWENPELIWFPHESSSFVKNYTSIEANGTEIYNFEHFCPHSRFFATVDISQYHEMTSGYCVGLSLNKFVMAIKPWRCQVEVNLLMPEYMLKI